jgi:5-methylcytosine-specific restriction endonuclease McrBC GTP-binding regulatory subunit McrB
MKLSKAGNETPTARAKLRNFDLTVEEIRILKVLEEMTRALEDIETQNIRPIRQEYFRSEIRRLEDQLEEIRENTLIR